MAIDGPDHRRTRGRRAEGRRPLISGLAYVTADQCANFAGNCLAFPRGFLWVLKRVLRGFILATGDQSAIAGRAKIKIGIGRLPDQIITQPGGCGLLLGTCDRPGRDDLMILMRQRFEELIAGAEHDSAGAYHRALRGGERSDR